MIATDGSSSTAGKIVHGRLAESSRIALRYIRAAFCEGKLLQGGPIEF